MPLDQTANFQRAEITDGFPMAAADNDVYFIGADEFPDPANGEYNLVIFDQTQFARPDQDPNVEIVRATSRLSSVELAVDRGQEGTTASDHPAGSAVMLTFTAGLIDQLAPTDDIGITRVFDAITFQEDDVSVNLNDLRIDNNNITTIDTSGSPVDVPHNPDGSSSYDEIVGVAFEANEPLFGVKDVVVDSQSTGPFGNIVLIGQQEGIMDKNSNLSGELRGELKQGNTYAVGVEPSSGSATSTYDTAISNWPRNVGEVTLVGFYEDGFTIRDYTRAIQSFSVLVFGGGPTSGSANITWSNQADIGDWQAAAFERTTNGETMDVYLAFDDGNGFNRTNGGNPIPNNYSIKDDSNIQGQDKLRYELEMSRQDTTTSVTFNAALLSKKT